MMRQLKWMSVCAMVVCGAAAHGATHYILEGGDGDGTSWSSPLGDLPTTFVRGDTYYVGDGSYGGHAFNTAASGTTVITVKKATAADHGTETGWSAAYGDGQAMFLGVLNFSTAYWVFDGQARDEDAWGDKTAYGFLVRNSTSTPETSTYGWYVTGTNVTLRYLAQDGSLKADLALGGYIGSTVDGLTVHRCLILNNHDDGIKMAGGTNILIEYIWLGARLASASGKHGDAIEVHATTNVVYRHNKHTYGADGIHFGIMNNLSDEWDIYGNVFWGIGGTAIKVNSSATDLGDIRIYNNTWSDCYTALLTRGIGVFTVRNSLYYEVTAGKTTHTTNITATTDPFVNAAEFDFRIVQDSDAIDTGEDLGATYGTDGLGTARGSSGEGWDSGAFEFAEEGDPPEEPVEGIASFAASAAAGSGAPTFLTLTWSGTGVTGHLGYKIERSLTTSTGFVQVGTAADDAESYRDNALTPGVRYYYRIRSYNATGNGDYSTEADATTPVISGRSVRPQSAGGAGLW